MCNETFYFYFFYSVIIVFLSKDDKVIIFILLYIYIYFYFENLTAEWPYFLGNILVWVRVVFLPDCRLVFSLLKHRGVGVFLNQKKKKEKKKRNPNQWNPLNSSIDNIFKKSSQITLSI